jgi:hypothetical protein
MASILALLLGVTLSAPVVSHAGTNNGQPPNAAKTMKKYQKQQKKNQKKMEKSQAKAQKNLMKARQSGH